MNRKEILSSPEYWIAKTQMDLYNCAEQFMETNQLNRTQLAKHLEVSKGYVSQLLNGDYDHKLSKLVELALAFGYVPKIDFQPLAEILSEDERSYKLPEYKTNVQYTPVFFNKSQNIRDIDNFEALPTSLTTNVA